MDEILTLPPPSENTANMADSAQRDAFLKIYERIKPRVELISDDGVPLETNWHRK